MDRIVEIDHFSERQAAKVTSGVLMALDHIHSLGASVSIDARNCTGAVSE